MLAAVDEEASMENRDYGSGLGALGLGFILGSVVGVAIGLLYAPQAGIETRHMIAEKAAEVKEKAAEAVDMVKEKAAHLRHSQQAES
jgi:gas vesicle protein